MNIKIAGQYVDLFEFYGLQPPALKKVVEKYMDKYIEGEMDYSDTAEFEREVEKLGYTFDSGFDNEPYGLRPIGVELNQLKGFEEFSEGGKISNPITFGDLKVGETYFQVTRPDLGIEKITITSINGNRGYEYVSDKRNDDATYATKYQGTYLDREELYGIYVNANDAKNKAIEILTERMSKYAKGGRISDDEYYQKMKEARSSGFDNPYMGKILVKTTMDLTVDDVGMDIPEGTEGYIFYEPRDAEDLVGVEIDGYFNYLPQSVLEVVFAKGGAMHKLENKMKYSDGGKLQSDMYFNEYFVNGKLRGVSGNMPYKEAKEQALREINENSNITSDEGGKLKYNRIQVVNAATHVVKFVVPSINKDFTMNYQGKEYSDGGKTNNKMKNEYFDERETTVFQSKGLANKNVKNKLTLTFDKEYDNGFIQSVIYNADNGYVFREERIPVSGQGMVKLYSMLDKLVNDMAYNKFAKGGNTNMAEWIAVFMNPKEQNKVITVLVYGNSITEALKSAVISTFFLDIGRDYELINIYAIKGSRRTDTNYAWGVGYAKGGKIGFKALAEKVAKRYEGTNVPRKYQSEYGKRYDRAEAREVGNKVAAKVYRQQQGKMAMGGRTGIVKPYPKIEGDINVIE
jgi:hypothetical protein